jgi:predicted enzyme related to lactoylglutathione lyase
MAETAPAATNTPFWIDLGSADPEASRRHYTKLFGWTVDSIAAPVAGGYGIFKLDGKEVAGVGPPQDPNQPTSWTMYVVVADADATAQKVKAAGGTVLAEPFDVPDAGRMAIVADPAGAVTGIWQSGSHQGGWAVRDIPGSVGWVELNTRGFDATKPFYQSVFGWDPVQSEMPGPQYTEFQVNGTSVAGGWEMPEGVEGDAPSHWLIYFSVEDADAVTRHNRKLGGETLMEPTDITPGRFAVLRDPQGAAFAVIKSSS